MFLLEKLINIKKSILQPCQEIEFSGIIVNSRDIILTLQQGQVTSIIEQCQLLLSKQQVTMKKIMEFIVKLSYSVVVVL